MTVEAGLIARLLADTDVNTIIQGRIRPVRFDQNQALPAILTNFISRIPLEQHDSRSNAFRCRVQIDCWGKTYKEAKDLAKKVRLCLDKFVGNLGGDEVSGLRFLDESDDFESEAEDFRQIQEYEIIYQES